MGLGEFLGLALLHGTVIGFILRLYKIIRHDD